MFKLGLTGSIGSGKSTTATMFRDLGCDVWDADAAVHRLYSAGGAAAKKIGAVFPNALRNDAIDRSVLKQVIQADARALKTIENIVHPLVRLDREQFFHTVSTDIAVFDIPLLFETNAQTEFDAVACVFIDPEEQRRRVLERGTMSESQFEHILSQQMPALEKVSKSDFVIHTDTLEHAREQVHSVVTEIREGLARAGNRP